jgi:pimeloyl-ACP methyl ester carboxylesterase
MKKRLFVRTGVDRIIRTLLPAAIIFFVGIFALFNFLVYRITNPPAIPEPVNPSYYQLPSLEIVFSSSDRLNIAGWWIPGLRGAPGIVLSPGYGMSRSDVLSLAAVLHESGFNILIYDQRGSRLSAPKPSTLGLYETDDLLCALQYLKDRPEINRTRLGIWGVDVGAIAALKAAASVPEVVAIAADGAFESPYDFLDLRVGEDFGLNYPVLQFGCRRVFGLLHIGAYAALKAQLPLQALSNRMILFIEGENRAGLDLLTSALHKKIQPQKELISFKDFKNSHDERRGSEKLRQAGGELFWRKPPVNRSAQLG